MSKRHWCLMFLGFSLYMAYIVGSVEYLHSIQGKMRYQNQADSTPSDVAPPAPKSRGSLPNSLDKSEALPVPPTLAPVPTTPAQGQQPSDSGTPPSPPQVAPPAGQAPSKPRVLRKALPGVFYADSVGYPDTYKPEVNGTNGEPVYSSIDEVFAVAEPEYNGPVSMQIYDGGPSVRLHAVQVPEPSTVIIFTWGLLICIFAVKIRLERCPVEDCYVCKRDGQT